MVNHELEDAKVKMIDGRYYVENSVVATYINSRFYWDSQQQVMLYTLPTEEFQIVPESTQYVTSAGTQMTDYVILKQIDGGVYLDLEFVSQYTDMTYTAFEDPARVVVRTKWNDLQLVTAQKNSEIRQKGGIKSSIVAKVKKGDTLYLQEELDNWSRVATADGYSGYIKKEVLSDPKDDNEEHASTVPEYTNISKDYKINLAFHQVTSMDGNATLAQMVADAQGVNTISPTWFYLADDEGNIGSFASQEIVNAAHNKGIDVWGMVDNFTNPDITTAYILGDEAIRTKVIDSLISLALQYNLDGLNIDFESLKEEAGEPFIQFIRELSIKTRANNLVLSVDNYVPKAYTNLYNRKEQGVFADYVIIMGYDEHYNGSTVAGSVASIGYVTEGIDKTLEEVPKEKVINALPFYTRMWTVADAVWENEADAPVDSNGNPVDYVIEEVQTLPMQQAIDAAKSHSNAVTVFDETTKQNYVEWSNGNRKTMMWLEDATSLEAKLQVMKERNIAGVAVWQLGYGEPFAWEVISKYY